MKKTIKTGAFVAAAVAGLMMTGKVMANDPAHAGAEGKVLCSGINECKGKSACKGGDNASCKGHNACKGKGVIEVSKSECEAKKGKEVPHSH